MPLFKWHELKSYDITPSKSVAHGKTIYGNMIFLQMVEYKDDRGDGKIGAYPHYHPEEQFYIVLKGVLNQKVDGKWYSVKPGEVFWQPAYKEHESVFEGDGLMYIIKTRIPGHSWYDGSWQPGAEEAWNEHFANFKDMSQKFREVVPWEKGD